MPDIPGADYWRRRAEAVEKLTYEQGAEYLKAVDREFAEALRRLQAEIEVWYQRLAQNNGISLTAARQLLKADELEEFHWNVRQYIKAGQENTLDQRWMRELENASAKVHISRLEAIKLKIQQEAQVLFRGQEKALGDLLESVYQNQYYHMAYEVHKGICVGWDLQTLDSRQVEHAVSRPWSTDGKTFSDRIWANQAQLVNSLQTHLTQSIIRGDDGAQAVKAVAKDMGASRNQAARLVMTERAHTASQAQRKCFRDLGVERYQIIATLDNRTSQVCRDLDGKVFDMADYDAGVTAPPFHPWCRTCTAPYFEDMADLGERIARDPDTGMIYEVPRSLTYSQWKQRFTS